MYSPRPLKENFEKAAHPLEIHRLTFTLGPAQRETATRRRYGARERRKMSEQRERHEFKVVIEGIALSPETVLSIDQAVQTTVINELANIDLSESLALDPLPGTLTEGVATGRFSADLLSSITPWNSTSGIVASTFEKQKADLSASRGVPGNPFGLSNDLSFYEDQAKWLKELQAEYNVSLWGPL